MTILVVAVTTARTPKALSCSQLIIVTLLPVAPPHKACTLEDDAYTGKASKL